jgi:hypothetical protein
MKMDFRPWALIPGPFLVLGPRSHPDSGDLNEGPRTKHGPRTKDGPRTKN